MSSSQPPTREKRPLGFDDLIAIVIAFGAIGAIFFWVTGRNPDRFRTGNFQFPAVFSQPAATSQSPTILTPAVPNSEVRSPATTVLPSPSPAAPVAPVAPVVPPILPVLPPVSVNPEQPVTTPIPATVGPKTVGPKTVGPKTVGPKTVGPKSEAEKPAALPKGRSENALQPNAKPKADQAQVGPVKFTDVSNQYWAYPFIIALADRKIFADFTDSKFRPDEPMTRAELAKLIQRMSEGETRRKPVDFKDVKDGTPTAEAIDRSVQTGYLRGYPDKAFRPDKEVPRVEAIAALASGLNLKHSAKSSQILGDFTDRKKVPKWAVDKVAAATEAGIVVNHPNPKLLQPNQIATRAEVAAMVYQAMAKKGKVPAKASKYVLKP
ncbi:MAG: S-layer homology domain-containing protein [Oscillatoriaceae cyanobacterium Prado104]|nr:S-layer homology domain-containing protein [Oscillatoriaceae cyanobacterium Prado104]